MRSKKILPAMPLSRLLMLLHMMNLCKMKVTALELFVKYRNQFIPSKVNEVKLFSDHLNMSNALNDKDRVEEKLILAARHLAKQNDEKQPKDDLDISGELLNDMTILNTDDTSQVEPEPEPKSSASRFFELTYTPR